MPSGPRLRLLQERRHCARLVRRTIASSFSVLSVQILFQVLQIAQQLFDCLIALFFVFAQRPVDYPLYLARRFGRIPSERRRLSLKYGSGERVIIYSVRGPADFIVDLARVTRLQ